MNQLVKYLSVTIMLTVLGCESADISDPSTGPNPPVISQQPKLHWQQTLGGSRAEEFPIIQQTNDGGYIMAALTLSSDGDISFHHNPEHNDIWLVKLDNSGTIIWERSLGGSGSDIPTLILQLNDGGYLLGAVTNSSDGDVEGINGQTDWWIVRLDADGNIKWESTLGGSHNEYPGAVIQEEDEFIIAGTTSSSDGDVGNKTTNSTDVWIVKMNDEGVLLWEKSFGDELSYVGVTDIYRTKDQGYMLAGEASRDIRLIKFDSEFSIIWEQYLGGSQPEFLKDSEQTEKGMLLTATSFSTDGDVTESFGHGDIWLVEVDEDGTVLWERSYGGSDAEEASSVIAANDDGYWLCGSSASANGHLISNNGAFDYWVLRLNAAGDIIWQQSYGGSLWDRATSITSAGIDGILVAGHSASRDGHIHKYKGQVFIWLTMIE